MNTKSEIIAQLRSEYPIIQVGSDEDGYVELNAKDYETTIENWASNQLEQKAQLAKTETLATAKSQAIDKLIALGIDPKALGL
jgi:hypothetical protein